MYSDLTHFVYELLQNADDYEATEIYFKLTQKQVIIEHNGTPFTPSNITAITSFGESTSRDNMLKSGRFGVGFKSVFAFTATPIIISGDEHFMIHGLYRVSEHAYPDELPRDRTRIVLPFNHEIEKPDYVEYLMSPEEAYEKISERLTDLNMHTLLFTHNIREIRWEIDEKSGHYLREDNDKGAARHTTITDGKDLNNYLVFSRTPRWEGQSFKNVDIGFGLDEDGQICTIQDFLYVLFCTSQETHLQFILNGPYKTNPSRETISEEDPFNQYLIKETCNLLGDILPYLREDGLLTTQFLGVLPNISDNLRPFYKPLFNIVIKCFNFKKLVPTADNKFATAQKVFQGPGALRKVVTPPQLAFLEKTKNISWTKGVVPNTRSNHFLKSLDIKQWGYRELQKALISKYGDYNCAPKDASWLKKRTDRWLQKLYILLGEALSKGECDKRILQQCKIIRVLKNGAINHTTGKKAYFPKDGYDSLPAIMPAILRGRTKQQTKKIEERLVALGVQQIGDEERIDLILEMCYSKNSPQIKPKEHINHMRLFIKWWKQDRSVKKFSGKSIFHIDGKNHMRDSSSCYLDTPLKSSGLSVIYKRTRKDIKRKYKLWKRYHGLNSEGFYDFAIACGVAASLPIEQQSCHLHRTLSQNYYSGVHRTHTGIDQDYIIPELDTLLRRRNIDINRLIWDTLRNADPEKLTARFRPNKKYRTSEEKSSLILILTNKKWIPAKNGSLHKPAEITKESLESSFKYDDRNGWLTAIGFAEKTLKATAEYRKKVENARASGLTIENYEDLNSKSPEERVEINAELNAIIKRKERAKETENPGKKEKSVPFHQALNKAFDQAPAQNPSNSPTPVTGTSQKPERRKDKLGKEISSDIDNEPSPETRSTFRPVKKWTGKNKDVKQKLLHWYAGQCQICGKTFQQHNGEPYFEGLYLVSYTKAEWTDRPGNVLCLCSWHSAMFQFGSKHVNTDIASQVHEFVPQQSGGNEQAVINLTLCGTPEIITFHEDHLIELQVMLQKSKEDEESL